MITLAVIAVGSAREPEVPVQIRRGILLRGTRSALSPDRPIRPDVNLLDGSEDTGSKQCGPFAESAACGALVAHLRGDLHLFGDLAQLTRLVDGVGQRLLDTTSKSMIRQGLETLNKTLQARIAVNTGSGEVEYKPPSESEFAAAVAKDMAGEALSSSRTIWIAVTVVIIIVIVALIIISIGGG